MKNWMRNILTICVFAGALIFSSGIARAADHNDAADIMGAAGSFVDITDVFAFRSPANADNLVIYVGLFTPEVAGSSKLFATDARYEFYIDTNGDVNAEHTIRGTVEDAADGTQIFHLSGVPGAGNIDGNVTVGDTPNVVVDGPAQAFFGLRRDQFFFDLVGFRAFVAAPCIPSAGLRCPGTGAPADFFLGRNTATIAVEFPLTSLRGISSSTSGNLNIWAKTFTQTN